MPVPGKGNAVVDEARRLLMRLATQMHSHPIDLARLEPRAAVASSPVDLTGLARRGRAEPDASPQPPKTHFALLPEISGTGADDGDKTLVFYGTASGDQTRFLEDATVFVREAPMMMPAPPLAHPVIESEAIASFSPEIRLAGGSVADAAMTPLAGKPVVSSLPITAPAFAQPSKTASRVPSLHLTAPKIRLVPDRVAADVALERRRAALPPEETPAGRAVHLMTRQLLAKAAGEGVREEDIVIVGVYRRVPIGAAAKMAFDDQTNALCLTLRPDAARVVQSQGQQVVSLVFGRVRADGRMVRALVPAPKAPSR